MKSSEIRFALKSKLGYNSRQVSVKERSGGLSWSFTLTVRDPKVNLKKVEDLTKSMESIDYCHSSGEILSGGNTFIFVSVTPEVEATWAEKYIDEVESALSELESSEFKSVRVNDRVSLHDDGFWLRAYVDGMGGRNFDRNYPNSIATYIYKQLEF